MADVEVGISKYLQPPTNVGGVGTEGCTGYARFIEPSYHVQLILSLLIVPFWVGMAILPHALP